MAPPNPRRPARRQPPVQAVVAQVLAARLAPAVPAARANPPGPITARAPVLPLRRGAAQRRAQTCWGRAVNISEGLFGLLAAASILLALLLSIVDLPQQYVWLRPELVCLVVLYWVLYTPQRIGLGIAWLVGLAQDVVEASVWGAHAPALCLVAYIVQASYQRLCAHSPWQQCFGCLCWWVFTRFCQLDAGPGGLCRPH